MAVTWFSRGRTQRGLYKVKHKLVKGTSCGFTHMTRKIGEVHDTLLQDVDSVDAYDRRADRRSMGRSARQASQNGMGCYRLDISDRAQSEQ